MKGYILVSIMIGSWAKPILRWASPTSNDPLFPRRCKPLLHTIEQAKTVCPFRGVTICREKIHTN